MPRLIRLIALALFAILIPACNRSPSTGPTAAATDEKKPIPLPDGTIITRGKEIPRPDLSVAAASAPFKAAIATATQLTGVTSAPIALPEDDQPNRPSPGVMFKVPHDKVEASLDAWRKQLLAQGAYLFRMDNSFGISGATDPDTLGLLPTTDQYIVLAVVQPNGANFSIMTGDIIDWLKAMEKTQPFELSEAGLDFLAGKFKTPLKDPDAMAKQMYDFCPDIVDQGTGDVDKLASELKDGKLYFWWD